VKIKGNEKYEFYSIQLLLIQPNPTHGMTQPMSISGLSYLKIRGHWKVIVKKGNGNGQEESTRRRTKSVVKKVKEKTAMEWKWIRRFANTYRLFVCVCVTMVCHHA